jgi:hypothetical protein
VNYTKTNIFNLALKNLGVSVGIQSTGQSDRNAVVMNEYYEIAKEKTLKDHDWSFASTYRELTPTGNKSLNPKFSHEYDYPNDCAFAREIVTSSEEPIEFEPASNISGQRVILTNATPATIRYTRIVKEEAYYTPEFAMALSWFLAFLSASSITGARTKTSDCLQIYKKMLAEGMTTDANEGFIKTESVCNWLEERA